MKLVPEAEKPKYCNFCGKTEAEVSKLIAGATANICNECVELCNDIIERKFVPGTLAKRLAEKREGDAS